MKKIIILCLFFVASFTLSSQNFAVGDKVWAFENDDALWYQATILEKVDAIHYKIHWEGFSAEYDEAMSLHNMWKEGMPYVVGDKIQGMETDGKWYNVKILKRDLDKKMYFINWGGFDEKYNRWISYDSLRLQTKQNKIEEGSFDYKSNYSSSSSSGGSVSISISLKNKCGSTVYYIYESGGGSSTKSTLGGNSSTSLSFMKSGYKIWSCDSNGNKSSLLFEVSSAAQDNSEVVLCR